MKSVWVGIVCAILTASTFGCSMRNNQVSTPAAPHQYEPGFNLFSKEQDVQLGKEAAGEIEKQVEVVDNRELNNYINSIGQRLAAQPQADKYPYTFKVVNEPSINAFALPGGPTFVHTGLIAAADNEAQIAGVLAHEIVHVALRHGTNQASKANLIQLPAMIASGLLGSGSMLAQLGQLGIGLGAESVLMKFSRTAETQADLLGVQIAAQSGYNPIEMARFFQKLEADGGARGPQFFSGHPNPGNRMQAIEDEFRYLPPANYNADTGRLGAMKAIVAKLPAPRKKPQQAAAQQTGTPVALSIPNSRPSGRMQEYRGRDFSIAYPDNWKPYTSQNSPGVTIVPLSGIQQSEEVDVGYGAVLNYYKPRADADLRQATAEFVSVLQYSDPRLRVGPEAQREVTFAGKNAILTTLNSDSIFQGQTEVNLLLTVAHPNGIFFVVFVAPESEARYANPVFEQMLQSMRFGF